jgi:hypothetical protein
MDTNDNLIPTFDPPATNSSTAVTDLYADDTVDLRDGGPVVDDDLLERVFTVRP